MRRRPPARGDAPTRFSPTCATPTRSAHANAWTTDAGHPGGPGARPPSSDGSKRVEQRPEPGGDRVVPGGPGMERIVQRRHVTVGPFLVGAAAYPVAAEELQA